MEVIHFSRIHFFKSLSVSSFATHEGIGRVVFVTLESRLKIVVSILAAKPRKFDLSFRRPVDSEETQFKCQVEGIFPEPQVLMYRVEQTQIAGE